MADPMSDERLAEIRGYVEDGLADMDTADLLAEVEDLRVKADRYVRRIQTLARKHARAVALRATLRDLLRIQEKRKHEARAETSYYSAELEKARDAVTSLTARLAQAEQERDRLTERFSTSPARDDATGLETLCAALHTAPEVGPEAVEDLTWRTLALIHTWREQGAELGKANFLIGRQHAALDRLNAQVGRVRAAHPPELRGGRRVCGTCLDAHQEQMLWPCPTIRALDGTEAQQ